MPKISQTVRFNVPTSVAYTYLKTRHESDVYRSAAMELKGYIPARVIVKDNPNECLVFQVPGRDGLTGIKFGGWRWGFDFKPVTDEETEITYWYKWGFAFGLLGLGTLAHQAKSELLSNVLALEALTWDPNDPGRVSPRSLEDAVDKAPPTPAH